MLPLRYQGYAIVLEEVPNEISLAFNISGCPHHCDGCHSQHLWEYKGELLSEDIQSIIEQYKEYISCVCFMGGDQNIEELESLCSVIKNEYNLKTCVYSGEDNINIFQKMICNNTLDYLKIGRYMKDRGGLNRTSTNQKMYKIKAGKIWDITTKFQKIKGEVG